MKAAAPSGWPLWPLPLVAGALPALASVLAWAIATERGLIPACNPFIEGCVSISRAARHELPNHLFRSLVLPAAVLQALCWLASAAALSQRGGDALRSSARMLAVIGVAAGIALVLYGAFLGTDGAVYRALRRWGTIVYFGGTCLAMLLTARALQRLQARAAVTLPRTHERALLALLGTVVAMGIGNAVVATLAGDPQLQDRIENATEWWGALGLTLAFFVLASLWRRLGLAVAITTAVPRP
jgi:hypothetical protein